LQGGQEDSRDPGLFTILARIKNPQHIAKVREEIYAAIETAKTKPISDEQLAKIQSFLKYGFAMGLNSADSIARTISHYVQLTGDPESINRLYQMYDKVTAKDIMRVANKYFGTNNRTVVLLKEEAASKQTGVRNLRTPEVVTSRQRGARQ
jgi:zinc protease